MNETIYEQIRRMTFKQIIENSVFIKKIEHSLFGESELLLHKHFNTNLLLITKIYNRKEQINKLVEESTIRLKIQHQNILRLISYNVKEIQELCGSFYRFQLIYEYSSLTLYDNIQMRSQNQQHYTDKELIQILSGILNGLQILKQFSIRHGYLQPKHILYQKQNIIITDIRFMTQTYEYQRQLISQEKECYLSPEQFQDIQHNNKDQQSNYEKNEIFSIAITMLYCINLTYPQVYNYSNYTIQDLQSQFKLKGVGAIIQQMLQIDQYNRPSLEQLTQMLNQFNYNDPILKENLFMTVKQDQKQQQQDQSTVKRNNLLTPITHQSRSPVSRAGGDDSYFESPFNFTHRPRASDRQTKPCLSPFRSIGVAESTVNTSCYDFAMNIKMDAPKSLLQEFSKISNTNSNYNSKFNY